MHFVNEETFYSFRCMLPQYQRRAILSCFKQITHIVLIMLMFTCRISNNMTEYTITDLTQGTLYNVSLLSEGLTNSTPVVKQFPTRK